MKKYNLIQKALSLFLSFVLIVGLLPSFAFAGIDPMADISDRISDLNTMNGWQDFFGPDKLSTEFAGGVWTDKSVLTSATDFSALITMDDPENNFLVALSAIAANQQVVGYASDPLDVMLVLDVSGSMQNNNKDEAMVDAANLALDALLKDKANNRVGVVLYSGASRQGVADSNTATVILPLDHYTTTATDTVEVTGENGASANKTIGKYLNLSNNRVSVNANVKDSEGDSISAGKAVSGGTYIQNGIYQAWGEFSKVTDTVVPEGNPQAGDQRKPVMILMSDGQPTHATANYNNVDNSSTTYGDGTESSTSNRTVFLTQLTAAWVKGKMAAHYKTTPKFYTVGLGTNNSQHATAVLNPSQSNDTVDDYWTKFLAGTNGNNVNVGSTYSSWNIYKDSNVTAQNYTDGYWSASNAAGLLAAFQGIMDTIELDAAGHVTLVGERGEDFSGYVTITDELGCFIDVKDVKGLVLGSRLFTGHDVAESMLTKMGDKNNPTAYGDEFVNTIRERLGIEDITVAQQLITAAYNDGQLAFDGKGTTDPSDDTFSNFIGWYSNDAGDYLGYWDTDTGITADGAPTGATWINKSYIYVGENGNSDMMHVVVMVCTHIVSGMQVVQYKIPASLIPKVTYEVELEGEDKTQMKSITRKEAYPLRLVYEVGLQDGLNSINLEDRIASMPEGVHVHENADGTYHFYTNLWGAEHGESEVDYTDPLSHRVAQSHFHPAEDNGRYYYTEDTPIYTANGTVYTGTATPSGSGYFRKYNYYNASGYTSKLIAISSEALSQAERGADGTWYIPEGVVFQEIERFYLLKGGDSNADGKADSNRTGTLEYANYPVVVRTGDTYDVYAFLGNNGRLTLKPAQGIKLSKTVTETVAGAPESFTFKVTLSQTVQQPVVTDADGKAWTGDWSVSGNVITVALKAGETVYITGLPTGVGYTVAEVENRYYAASSQNAIGSVAAHTITPVNFTNTPKGYGSLIVSKDVEHPYVSAPTALTQKQFIINVTLSGEGVANTTFPVTGSASVTQVTTDANGKFTVLLRDNESLTVNDLPEGTTFVTTETLDPQLHRGFSVNVQRSVLSGTIVKNTAVQTHVVNEYTPGLPQATLKISGSKILKDEGSTFDWTGKSFTVRLEQYDPDTGTYVNLGEKTVTAGSLDYLFEDEIILDAMGTYYFKVSEVIPTDRLEGMSYDATVGRLRVEVTDEDVDGYLEFNVFDYDTNAEITATELVYNYEKDFTNIHTTDATFVEFTVDKNVVDPHNTGVSEAGFLFELIPVINGVTSTTPAFSMRTVLDAQGQGHATFHIPVNRAAVQTFILKEYIPAEGIPGMIYDTTEYMVFVEGVAQGGKLVPKLTITKGGQEVDLSAGNISFTNEIDLEPVVLKPYVHKTIDGRAPMASDSFQFHIEQTNGSFVPGSFTNGYSDDLTVTYADLLSGTDVYFEELEVYNVGTYYFRIWEIPGTAGGMTYDNSIYHMTVNVTVDGNQLKKNVTYVKVGASQVAAQADAVKFVNVYRNTDTAQVTLDGTKVLSGRNMIIGEFEFQLSENGSVLQTVANRANGTFQFAPITYTAADVGVHTYTVTEVTGTLGGVTYSNQSYTVTVTVTDNGQGELETAVSGNANIVFTNAYAAQATEITVNGSKSWLNTDTNTPKTMTGGEFTFRLYPSDETYTTKGTALTKTNSASGAFAFTLDYSAPGRYYYILNERIDDATGVDYDTSEYHILVTVYDDGQGNLVANLTAIIKVGIGNVSAITFGNVYTPEPVEHAIEGEKELIGRPLLDGEFDFQLFAADESYAPSGDALQTVSDVGGRFAFDAIEYTKSGTYYYVVKEVIPTQAVNNVYQGIAYDTSVFGIKVVVTDSGAGTLQKEVTVTKGGAAAELKFENSYTVTNFTSFDISGTKDLDGIKDLQAGMFTFELYDEAGNRFATTTNDAQGNFTFHDIPLDKIDPVTHTYTYTFTIKEAAPQGGVKDGITYDPRVYTVTVEVHDDLNGNLVAGTPVVTLNGTSAELKFENSYAVEPASYQPRVLKILEGKTLQADMFTFQLKNSQGGVLQEKKNLAGGGVVFDAIEYIQPGTYRYTISEVVPAGGVKDGITYDTHTVELTVVVTDNGDGTMSVDAQYSGLREFTNVYTVSGDPKFSVSGTKVLDGRDLNNNEFSFVLKDAGGSEIARVVNVGKDFVFTDVALNGLGIHHFTVSETKGSLGGVTYDETVYDVAVSVTDNGVGGMTVHAPIITKRGVAALLVFTNTYQATAIDATISGSKEVLNGELKAGDYTFDLYQTDGSYDITGLTPIASVANAADGSFAFGKDDGLYYTAADTYYYVLAESSANPIANILYDTAKYHFEVTVEDDGEGALSSQVDCVNGDVNDIVFRNVPYEEITDKDVFAEAYPTVSIDGKAVDMGDILLYKISYTNYNREVVDVTITDTIPQHTQFVSADNNGTLADGTLTWSFEDVPVDTTVTVSFRVKVTAAKVAVTNTAEVYDGVNTYNTEEVSVDVPEDIVVKDVFVADKPSVSVDGQNVHKGDVLNYTITYTNSDDFTANVTITDTIPQHTEYVAGSADNGGVFADGKITWSLQLAAGESKTVSFKVKVMGEGVVINNQAQAQEGENTFKTNSVTTGVNIPPIPETGDGTPIQMLFALMLMSATGIFLVLLVDKRKQRG